jgi:YbbR domain-containing protein
MAWHPFRNMGLKVGALALGTLLWFVVSGHQVERRLSAPISYSNVLPPLQLTGDQTDSVSVHVRGGDNLVGDLGDGALRVVVDLAGAHPGANIIPLRIDEVNAPFGVEVLQIEPSSVTVNLERAGQMDVLVRPTVEGVPADGYVTGAILVEPRTVTVAGPESRLRESVTVITERLMLTGRTSTLVQEVGVVVADAELRIESPHRVRVTVPIERARGVR